MSSVIELELLDYVSRGLKRAAVKRCSKWAETYRIIKGQPWRHDNYPWLRDIEDAESRLIIGQKAAQVGYTEAALNKTFYNIDIKKIDCLYVLPSESDASDFSSGRFDPALEESEHLQKMFSDVNNVGLKRAGNAMLYVRGSKSRSKLKSIPTGFIVLDEIEEMPEENIPLVLERFSGQEIKQAMMLSTPHIPGVGINKYYITSTMERFNFKCPSCGKYIELTFPDNIIVTAESVTDNTLKDSHYICHLCKYKLEHKVKIQAISGGEYVADYPGRANRGFQVNQMYSPTVHAWELAESYLKSLYDPTEEQEFYNSKLGKVHIVGDSRVTKESIDKCKQPYVKGARFTSPIITLGIDVGATWHYEIDEWHQTGDVSATLDMTDVFEPRLMEEGEIPLDDGMVEIIKFIQRYQVKGCVIDRHPETYVVNKISGRYPGLVYACMFGRSSTGRTISISKEDERLLTVDRTSWFDSALGRIISGKMDLPSNLSHVFEKQLQVPVRIYERDKNGNAVGRWVSQSRHDHFALARVYSEIALLIALENIEVQSTQPVF